MTFGIYQYIYEKKKNCKTLKGKKQGYVVGLSLFICLASIKSHPYHNYSSKLRPIQTIKKHS